MAFVLIIFANAAMLVIGWFLGRQSERNKAWKRGLFEHRVFSVEDLTIPLEAYELGVEILIAVMVEPELPLYRRR